MIATTIEQSKQLVRLGLDPKTADMVWMFNKWLYSIKDNILHREQFSEQDTLAWSLSALLEVIPNNDYWDIYLCKAQDGKWQSVWNDCEISNGEAKDFVADTPIDAVYEMVCWLLENNLIEKGGQDGRD